MKIGTIPPKTPKGGGTVAAAGGTSPRAGTVAENGVLSGIRAWSVHTSSHRAGVVRAFRSSPNPGLFPWQLSGELIKYKTQEQFEHTEPTLVTYQLTKLAALRFLVIKIDHVLATQSSPCHS